MHWQEQFKMKKVDLAGTPRSTHSFYVRVETQSGNLLDQDLSVDRFDKVGIASTLEGFHYISGIAESCCHDCTGSSATRDSMFPLDFTNPFQNILAVNLGAMMSRTSRW
jgi:hypothetical protein